MRDAVFQSRSVRRLGWRAGMALRSRIIEPVDTSNRGARFLDGRALWLMTFSAAQPTSENPRTLRLDGWAEPIYWNGTPDNLRTAHSFTFFLSDDAYRNPLRLVVPFGPGEAHAPNSADCRDREARPEGRSGEDFSPRSCPVALGRNRDRPVGPWTFAHLAGIQGTKGGNGGEPGQPKRIWTLVSSPAVILSQ